MSGSLASIVAKRARHILPGAELPHGDPTNERRAELSKHRSRLTRALDDASFEQAAIDYDACLDAIGEGVGKTHNITQDECDAESLWLCEMLESRGKGLPPVAAAPDDPLGAGALAPYAGCPPKKKARTMPGSGSGGAPEHKKEVVIWTKFYSINSIDMGITPERAASTDKEELKACAKLAKAHVTGVENAKAVLRVLNTAQPLHAVDPEKITSELVTTRTVKSDHLKFWYLKPNFKDKEIDLLLRVARHKSGLLWEVSHGVQQPAQCSAKDLSALSGMAGLGALGASAAAANAAAHRELSDPEAHALGLLTGPGGANAGAYAPHPDGQIVKAVVVGDTGLELGGMGADGVHDGGVSMHDLGGMGGADVGSVADHASVDTMIHAHMGGHEHHGAEHHAHEHADLLGGGHDEHGGHLGLPSEHEGGHEQMEQHVDAMQHALGQHGGPLHAHLHGGEQLGEPQLEGHPLEAAHEPALDEGQHGEHHLEAVDEPPISHHDPGHEGDLSIDTVVHEGDVSMDMHGM